MARQVQLRALWTNRPRRRCSHFNAGLMAGIIIALGVVTSAQQAAAQAGKVEKPNITFGVFPDHELRRRLPVLAAGVLPGRRPQRNATSDGREPGRRHHRRRFRYGRRNLDSVPSCHQPRRSLAAAERGRPRIEGAGAVHGQERFAIKTTEDLVGKKIAVVTVGGACDLILNDVLHKKGLDYKSIGYTVMGVPDMAPTVLRGGVDAACIPEPLLSVVQAQGGLQVGV